MYQLAYSELEILANIMVSATELQDKHGYVENKVINRFT